MPDREKPQAPSGDLAAPQSVGQQAVIKNVIASMSDGVMVINRQGEIVFTNPALSGILGLMPDQVQGRGWGELFFEDPANDEFNQIIVDVITERIYHYNKQVSYRNSAGERKELIVTTALLPGDKTDDEVGGVLVMFKDISELAQFHRRTRELMRQARRLYQEKLEGLDRLARAVAHEIRNPVTTIGGLAARLLSDKAEGSRDARYLRRILAGTERLERMVEEVRDYADLPSPARRPVDVRAWLRKVVKPHQAQAEQQGVRLALSGAADDSPGGEAEIDPGLLTRVMDILLENALEATPPGGEIRVSLMCDEISMVITVSDTGKGLSPADLPYVFDPFFTTKADAVGMSLAIAKRIALEHRGDLTAVSHGRGATFTLTIPRDGDPETEDMATLRLRPPELK